MLSYLTTKLSYLTTMLSYLCSSSVWPLCLNTNFQKEEKIGRKNGPKEIIEVRSLGLKKKEAPKKNESGDYENWYDMEERLEEEGTEGVTLIESSISLENKAGNDYMDSGYDYSQKPQQSILIKLKWFWEAHVKLNKFQYCNFYLGRKQYI